MLEEYEFLNRERKILDRKRRVAAYCRVSTDNDDQANSFESQQRYFKQYIEHHPDWELYEIFADEGISGTNTKKRKQFNRMITCAKNGDFDLIITKEISVLPEIPLTAFTIPATLKSTVSLLSL